MSNLIEKFSEKIQELAEYSITKPDKHTIGISLIINPEAARFRKRHTTKSLIKTLDDKISEAKGEHYWRRKIEFNAYVTECRGHASIIARDIAESKSDNIYDLMIVASGDGGYNEVCSGLVESSIPKTKNIRLIPLPVSFGNDACAVKDLYQALDFVIRPYPTEKIHMLKILDNQNNLSYACNVASIGLDGRITGIANNIKGIFGKQSYMIASKIGPLLYYLQNPKSRIAHIVLYTKAKEQQHYQFPSLLMAVGCKGHSNYGRGMKILPDDNNVCVIDYMNLYRLLTQEKKLYTGYHGDLPEVHFSTCSKVAYSSEFPSWMQRDGEYTKLSVDMFPITFELLKTRLTKVIR